MASAANVLALLQEVPEQASSPEPATSLSCLGETLTRQQFRDLDLDALQRLWEVSLVSPWHPFCRPSADLCCQVNIGNEAGRLSRMHPQRMFADGGKASRAIGWQHNTVSRSPVN